MNDELQNFLDELRSRISIADVIGQKVKLTKRGREYTGLCPFHHEKTPSFTINESKGFYHCFGCGAHGDIVRFLMDSEGLPFIEAVKKLADKVGMQLPAFSKESQEQSQKRKSLYEIMDMAAAFFEKNLRLPIGAKGLAYFKNKRGLSDEIIQKFRLGYAPNNNGLKALLISKGISESEMAELGLIAVPEDKNRSSHDFFRDRVMIPIMDKQGHIIAFGGRILDDGQPKYLNSPETPIFNKRRILYNMTHAREPAYAQKRLIICEGYMDVIALDSL
ncbi:MAG: DNA primase, partial [Alphaproteobacteria bacterium]|nr:DNA primase [Alphaproteobacteria bacterium]